MANSVLSDARFPPVYQKHLAKATEADETAKGDGSDVQIRRDATEA
jgi:hypothetical protein